MVFNRPNNQSLNHLSWNDFIFTFFSQKVSNLFTIFHIRKFQGVAGVETQDLIDRFLAPQRHAGVFWELFGLNDWRTKNMKKNIKKATDVVLFWKRDIDRI